jgi:hypothetical protein
LELVQSSIAQSNRRATRMTRQFDSVFYRMPELLFPLELGLMNGRSDLSHRGPVMVSHADLAAVNVAWAIKYAWGHLWSVKELLGNAGM